jgi:hypothetical protein
VLNPELLTRVYGVAMQRVEVAPAKRVIVYPEI